MNTGNACGMSTIAAGGDPDDPEIFLANLPRWFGKHIEFAVVFEAWIIKLRKMLAVYRKEGRIVLMRNELQQLVVTLEYQTIIAFGPCALCELLPQAHASPFHAWLYSPALMALVRRKHSIWDAYWLASSVDNSAQSYEMAVEMQRHWRQLASQIQNQNCSTWNSVLCKQ